MWPRAKHLTLPPLVSLAPASLSTWARTHSSISDVWTALCLPQSTETVLNIPLFLSRRSTAANVLWFGWCRSGNYSWYSRAAMHEKNVRQFLRCITISLYVLIAI
jgi:hypothetical protein